jgi:hypothetical protein
MDTVEIRWPSGDVQYLKDLAGDKIYTVVEAQGVMKITPLAPPEK